MENNKLKTSLSKTFQILLGVVLLGKVLHFIVDLPDQTNRVINVLMFSLIGIAYLVMGWVWKGTFPKLLIITCGLYLLAMNFFSDNTTLNIVAIICLLMPMLIARFAKSVNEEATEANSGDVNPSPVARS